MQISTNIQHNTSSYTTTKSGQTANQGLSASNFMSQIDQKIAEMIESIAFEYSDDPEFEQFLKEIRESYAGEAKSDYKTRDEINEDDAALQKFKDDLTSKGAIKFLYDFNMEKIEEMVEKYKAKLLKDLGENPTPEQLSEIEQMVDDYRKQLLEQLDKLNEKDKNSAINISNLQNKFLNNLHPNLENVLQEY